MNDLIWSIETINGTLLNEDMAVLQNIETERIKYFYFQSKKNCFGVNNKLEFFINNQIFDFKLKQKILKFFQYKEVSHSLMFDVEDICYNIGIEAEDDNYQYKYTMIIKSETNVDFLAQKFDNGKEIEKRKVKLR